MIYDQVSLSLSRRRGATCCATSASRSEPGQTVAILGTTGAGKSTLVNLLPRFYDVTRGSVRIDGHDVRDVTLASLRGQIGIVLQETLLFSGSVRDNIAYGKPDATQAEIEAAARAAQAHEFIAELPQGYDTLVGERGVGLSGGQRQRLAIARALLVDPCLLILDDSTSAVDTETEAAIREALDRLIRARRRTVFVIAQRISTVRDADLILVLDDGGVAAQGRHEDLLRDSELYNQILDSQLRDGPVAATRRPASTRWLQPRPRHRHEPRGRCLDQRCAGPARRRHRTALVGRDDAVQGRAAPGAGVGHPGCRGAGGGAVAGQSGDRPRHPQWRRARPGTDPDRPTPRVRRRRSRHPRPDLPGWVRGAATAGQPRAVGCSSTSGDCRSHSSIVDRSAI